jgi:DNA-binding NtrC family response regulator
LSRGSREWTLYSGPVAQLGARFHGMEEVVGSNPTRSTRLSKSSRKTLSPMPAAAARSDAPSVKYSVAVVTEQENTFADLRRNLVPAFQVRLARSEAQIQALFHDPELHGIVVDLDSIGKGGMDAIEALAKMRQIRDDLVLVALTECTDPTIFLKASEAGADEFLSASADFRQLGTVLEQAIEKRALQYHGRRLLEQVESRSAFCGLIGGSAAMQRVYQAIQAVADSSASIVLRGESGSGKELVAHAVVQSGPRHDKPFICVNCSALPESLIESELFGYERGAFTGADAAKPGLIEAAHTGTLFLDEITTLNYGLQSKLLRVLQERSVQRLGGRSARKIDFRLITATNEDLEDVVKKGQFREDLYYRINVVPIFLPPLRERESDISLLVDHFLRIYCAANNVPFKAIEPEVLEVLEEYAWPGNVRELENLVQRLVVMVSDPVIRMKHLPQSILYASSTKREAMLIPEEGVSFDDEMARIEIAYLQAALQRTGGKKSAAASLLRIPLQKMKYLCRKYGLQQPE